MHKTPSVESRAGLGRGRLLRALSCLVLLGLSSLVFTQASIRYSDVEADQLFRRAVFRFHDGYHAEAVGLFQKVLSLQPNNQLAHVWLGKAYYHAGFESAAVQEWGTVVASGQASPALTASLEALQSRRGLSRDVQEDFAFFPVNELSQDKSKPNQFRRPASVLALSDGSSLVASFGTNSLVQIDANGRTMRNLRGGLTHFAGPFDLVAVNNQRYYATQMLSDQVMEFNLEGQILKAFGGHGSKPGQMIGPQYLTSDGTYLFVSDFGNRRIVKFDLDGNYIAAFGEHSLEFVGLERPTGLHFQAGVLYIGEASWKKPGLWKFDGNGNLIGFVGDERLVEIEDITPFQNGHLLISTRQNIYDFDPADESLSLLFDGSRDAKLRLGSTVLDPNGNLVASDFDGEKISWLSRLAGIYAGLHVQINRVVADRFPEVYLDVSVLDHLGNPVVGLNASNLSLSEGRQAAAEVSLIGAGWRESGLAGVVITQADAAMASEFNREALGNAVAGIVDGLGGKGRLALVSAGAQAALEAPVGASKQLLQASLQNIPRDQFWYLDLALRTAVPVLLRNQELRHIFFVGNGLLPEDAFARYGLEENTSYLRTNRVRFSVIQTEEGQIDPALLHLVAQTGGVVMQLYNPRGLLDLGMRLADRKDGSYILRYRSRFDTDFGRKYLPVEVEARLFQKSGRDESGYFAPLKL